MLDPRAWLWIGFGVVVVVVLALDLGLGGLGARSTSVGSALKWSALWVVLALAFNVGIYIWQGAEPATEFLTGYLIEKSLAIDNIFVFLVVFRYLHVPADLQHKVLVWGVLGALAFRAIFIAAGIAVLERFHWTIYVFGVFLVLTGVKIALQKGKQPRLDRNPALRALRRVVPVSDSYDGGRFVTRTEGRRVATPLLVALVVIEASDIVFAIDSIPAILAITRDPFIVYTSNVFAVLGLRALYFALAGVMERFHHLHYGLAAVLVFVGLKMALMDIAKVPVGVSLLVVAAILGVSIAASLLRPATPGQHIPESGT